MRALRDGETLLDEREAAREVLALAAHERQTVKGMEARERVDVADLGGERPAALRGAFRLVVVRRAVEDADAQHAERRIDEGALQLVVRAAALGERGVGKLPRLAVERDRVAIGGQGLGRVRRLEERRDRLAPIVAAREMVREQREPRRITAAALALEQRPDALVQLASLPQEQGLVRDFLDQALAETVLVGRENVLAVNDAASLETLELARDVDALAGEDLGELRAAELAPEHRRDLGDALRLGAETVETRADQLLDRVGNADVVGGAGEADVVVAAQEVAVLDERAGDLLGEEGVALRRGADASLERGRQPAAGDAAHDRAHVLVRQRAQVEMRQRGRRPPRRLVLRAVAHDQHHGCAVHFGHGERDHLARGVVHPVQVLEDHDNGTVLAREPHELGDGLECHLPVLLGRHVRGCRASGRGADARSRERRRAPRPPRRPCDTSRAAGRHSRCRSAGAACRSSARRECSG